MWECLLKLQLLQDLVNLGESLESCSIASNLLSSRFLVFQALCRSLWYLPQCHVICWLHSPRQDHLPWTRQYMVPSQCSRNLCVGFWEWEKMFPFLIFCDLKWTRVLLWVEENVFEFKKDVHILRKLCTRKKWEADDLFKKFLVKKFSRNCSLILVNLMFRVVTLNPGAVVEMVFTLERFFTSLF